MGASIMRAPVLTVLVATVWVATLAWPHAQSSNMFQASMEHPAIGYSTKPSRDAVIRLEEQLARGERRLTFEGPSGYLASLLAALDVPVSSQMLVFSENSLQRAHIGQKTPRAIYFNDTVSVGWAQGAGTIELAALDATQGVHFYSLAQTDQEERRFVRRRECLQCHLTSETLGVPGLFTSSVLPLSDNRNEYVEGWPVDHRTPIEDRWGGWFVTGIAVPAKHLGNVPVLHVSRSYGRAPVAPRLETVATAIDAAPYPSAHSDVVALLVFNHQAHATNLLVRLGWEARVAEAEFPGVPPSMWPDRVRRAARDAADYLLFLNEAPLPAPVAGGAGFAASFVTRAAADPRVRPLREFDLATRLFRVRCSYMIASEAFDALPAGARRLVYDRLWEVLSGRADDKLAARLSAGDRRDILDLLRTIKTDLPDAFRAGVAP